MLCCLLYTVSKLSFNKFAVNVMIFLLIYFHEYICSIGEMCVDVCSRTAEELVMRTAERCVTVCFHTCKRDCFVFYNCRYLVYKWLFSCYNSLLLKCVFYASSFMSSCSGVFLWHAKRVCMLLWKPKPFMVPFKKRKTLAQCLFLPEISN